jgi:hypothetical protein
MQEDGVFVWIVPAPEYLLFSVACAIFVCHEDPIQKTITTMRATLFLLSAALLFLATACREQIDWEPLFNGKDLSNWETYIGTAIEGYEDLAEKAAPEKVFSVTELEGEHVIHLSGEVNGALATQKRYENYHFHMEMKWGENKYGRRNSGLLYHSYGSFGAALGTWKNSHELQLLTGNMGDSYRMGSTYCEITVDELEKGNYQFDPEGKSLSFGKGGVSKIARKLKDAEKPVGRWNEIDLYCYGRQSVHVVNGETVMVNESSGKYDNGKVNALTSGQIQIQSEGGELYLRNVRIRDISGIPEEVLP